MRRLVKSLRNSSKVVFDSGRFDSWCVYVIGPDGKAYAPSDTTYFAELKAISQKYPFHKVYYDFVKIYNLTNASISKHALSLIDDIALTYNAEDIEIVERWFTVIYAGMIAEENKANAILKKRIKRLGMHQVLIQDIPAGLAAKFSIGKKWRELDELMNSLGF